MARLAQLRCIAPNLLLAHYADKSSLGAAGDKDANLFALRAPVGDPGNSAADFELVIELVGSERIVQSLPKTKTLRQRFITQFFDVVFFARSFGPSANSVPYFTSS